MRSKHFVRNPYAEMLYKGVLKLVENGNNLQDIQDIFELDDYDLDDLVEEYAEEEGDVKDE